MSTSVEHTKCPVTEKTYRETRKRAITIIILCAFFLFFKYLMQVSPSVITDQLMAEFHLQGVGLGILGSSFFWSYLIAQLFCGWLLDSFSIRWLCTAAILVSTAGLVMFSETSVFFFTIIGRVLMGAGAAFATVSYMKLTANWFRPKHFAMISGFVATAAMIGAIFGDAPLGHLAKHLGWRPAMNICTAIGIALAVLFAWIVRDEPDAVIHQGESPATSHIVRLKDLGTILKNPNNWLLMFYTGLAFSPVSVFAGLWGNPFLMQVYDISGSTLHWFTSFIFAGLAVGAPVLGYIADKLGRRKLVMIASALISLAALINIIYGTNQPHWLLAFTMFVFGFMSGSFMLGFAIGKEINPIAFAATVVAVINTGDPIVGSWAEPLIGKILDHTWNHVSHNGVRIFTTHGYHLALSSLVVYLILTCIIVMCLKIKKPDES